MFPSNSSNPFCKQKPAENELYSNEKYGIRQRHGWYTELKNEFFQSDVPESLRDDPRTRIAYFMRKRGRQWYFLGGVVLMLFCLLWYAYSSTRTAIDSVHIPELRDISIAISKDHATAASTNFAYRAGAKPVTCLNIQEGLWGDLRLSTLHAMLVSRVPEKDFMSCVCAPEVGVDASAVLLGDAVMYKPKLVALPWYLRISNAEVTEMEGSRLYPTYSKLPVTRHSIVNVEYMNAHCEESSTILRGEDARCMQACVQLINGKTVYDLQAK